MLNINVKTNSNLDLMCLGEILLRFDPETERIHNARSFRVFDGGAEYNVARNLSKVFRQKTAVVTALADNQIGRLAEDFAMQAGVDCSQIIWRASDGDANPRNGLYFIERGFGIRAPHSAFDRDYTAVSQLRKGDIDWREVFGENAEIAPRWFHTGGVFVGLSATTPDVAADAMRTARDNGTIISYDLNYRNSLWKNRGGRAAANALNKTLLSLADVVFGVLTDDFKPSVAEFSAEDFKRAAEITKREFPNLQMIISTLRDVESASSHSFSAVVWADGEVYKARDYSGLDVLDRVGSGDAFAAGMIYGLLAEKGISYAVECGAANGALTLTTVGDNSTTTISEIEGLIQGMRGAVQR